MSIDLINIKLYTFIIKDDDMTKKYKFPLTVIVILFILMVVLYGSYYLYKQNIIKNSAEVIIDEELSINYLNGRNIDSNDEEIVVNFSVINDSDNQSVFHINIEDISATGKNVTYNLYENNDIIIKDEEFVSSGYMTVSNFVNISANATKSYKLIIHNPSKEQVKLKLNIQKSSKEDPNFSQIILNDNSVNKESKTKVGEEIAINDEGIILDIDDNGNTYYFRGNVQNNYVSFANMLWRIVRINGDGTVKIILNNNITGSTIYTNKQNLEYLEKISNNNYNTVLNNWYNQNLKEYDQYISQTKYCIDINKEGENLSNYFRINLSNNPTFNCLGKKNNTKIGLLTVDEVVYAGATINNSNDYFYLNHSEINEAWWTMSPAKDQIEGIYYYEISSNGTILANSVGDIEKKLRPVINLNKDIEVTGKGTIDDPYTIK